MSEIEDNSKPKYGRGQRANIGSNENSHNQGGFGSGYGRPRDDQNYERRDRSPNFNRGGDQYNRDRSNPRYQGSRPYQQDGDQRGYQNGGNYRGDRDRSPQFAQDRSQNYQRDKSPSFAAQPEPERSSGPYQRSRTPERRLTAIAKYQIPEEQIFFNNANANEGKSFNDHFKNTYLELRLCTKCGSQYLEGTTHNCLATILSVHVEVQRVLMRKMRALTDITQKFEDLNNKYFQLKKKFEDYHMKGLINHIDKIDPFNMSPEEETVWLVQRLSEVQSPQYRETYSKQLTQKSKKIQEVNQKDLLEQIYSQLLLNGNNQNSYGLKNQGSNNQDRILYNYYHHQQPSLYVVPPPTQPPQVIYAQHPQIQYDHQKPYQNYDRGGIPPPPFDMQTSPPALSQYQTPFYHAPSKSGLQQQNSPFEFENQQIDNNVQSELNSSIESSSTPGNPKIRHVLQDWYSKRQGQLLEKRNQRPHGKTQDQHDMDVKTQFLELCLIKLRELNEKNAIQMKQNLTNLQHQFIIYELKSAKTFKNERQEVVKFEISKLESIIQSKNGLGSLYYDNIQGSQYIKGLIIFDSGTSLDRIKIQEQPLKERYGIFTPKISSLETQVKKHWQCVKEHEFFNFVFEYQ